MEPKHTLVLPALSKSWVGFLNYYVCALCIIFWNKISASYSDLNRGLYMYTACIHVDFSNAYQWYFSQQYWSHRFPYKNLTGTQIQVCMPFADNILNNRIWFGIYVKFAEGLFLLNVCNLTISHPNKTFLYFTWLTPVARLLLNHLGPAVRSMDSLSSG